eukprot:11289087-Prorocentrum_lima.AAC.1
MTSASAALRSSGLTLNGSFFGGEKEMGKYTESTSKTGSTISSAEDPDARRSSAPAACNATRRHRGSFSPSTAVQKARPTAFISCCSRGRSTAHAGLKSAAKMRYPLWRII